MAEPAFELRGGQRNHLVGQVAELRAIAELLERGHKIAVPVVDDDCVDLIVDYRIRVQVRSAVAIPAGSSSFSWKTEGLDGVDVFVLYAHELGAWWIVPTAELRRWPVFVGQTAVATRVSITLERRGAGGRRTVLDRWRDAWHVLDEPVA